MGVQMMFPLTSVLSRRGERGITGLSSEEME